MFWYQVCHFVGGAFFQAENKFFGVIFGKITNRNEFLGVSFERKLFQTLILIKFHILG